VAFYSSDRQPVVVVSGDDVLAARPGEPVKFVVLVVLP